MKELTITVNKSEIIERFRKMSLEANESIMPVIKNNANGIGTVNMWNILAEAGATIVACSYANEFYEKLKDREEMWKFAWIWSPDERYREVKKLILACKNWKQLVFCLENKIPYYVVFNIAMNRGGFKKGDIAKLKNLIGHNSGINVMTHCPFETKDGLEEYKMLVDDLVSSLSNEGFEVANITAENSYAFTNIQPFEHYCLSRVGEKLMLPQKCDRWSPNGYRPFQVKTYIADFMDLKAGDWVGYHMVELIKDTRVAVLPVGYYHFEVEYLKKVLIKDGSRLIPANVICSMHDTTIIEANEILDTLKEYEVILMDLDLINQNWNRCIQKTFKINPDMVNYEYI